MSGDFQRLLSLIPLSANQAIDWAGIKSAGLDSVLSRMAATKQDPLYHGEGDVYAHTKAVCQALIHLDGYQHLPPQEQHILFVAALLHDIGKTTCTRLEDGHLISPHHGVVGAIMARELLWHTFGLCGTPERQQFREAVCALIKYHSLPPHAIDDPDGEYKVLKTAAVGNDARVFTIDRLCLLEQADILGRLADNREQALDKTMLCHVMATELGCAIGPYPFPSLHTARAFMRQRTFARDVELFDDTWGEVILLSGLPGTGKDTWIQERHPQLPVVSLDSIRKELHISPTDNQGRVIAEAKERARELLRQKTPFIWNATNTSTQIRTSQISLFEQYGASVTTVFLETEWGEGLRRNAGRPAAVPEGVIAKLLSKLEMPESFECTRVIWETV